MSTPTRVLLALLIIGSLLGCAAPTAMPPTGSAVAASTKAPEQTSVPPTVVPAPTGGDRATTLIVGVAGDMEGWDPATASYFTATEIVQTAYDRLVEYEVVKKDDGLLYADTSKIKGMLAETYSVSSDGLTYTFALRKGVKFQSGNELTSADVEFSFDRAIEIGEEASDLGWLLHYCGVGTTTQTIAEEPYTFKLQLNEPNNLLLSGLTLCLAGIVDSKTVLANATTEDPRGEKYLRSHTAGTGPFYVEGYEAGNQLVYAANKSYWKGAPKLGKIIYKTVPSAQDRVMMLISGAIDQAYDIPPLDITSTLQGKPGVRVLSYPTVSTTMFFFDNTKPPFDNPKVRKAMCYAVPYDALIQKVLYGLGQRPIGPVAPGVAFAKAVNECEYDPDMAKGLLAEAGYANGFDMTLSYRQGRPEEEAAAILLQAELAKYGIKVTMDKVQSSAWSERRSKKDLTAGIDGYTPYVPDPAYVISGWYVPTTSGDFFRYDNERVTELSDLSVIELDAVKRKAQLEEAQDLIGTDQPVVWLFNPYWSMALRDNVEGYIFYPDRLTRHFNLYKE